MKKRSILSILGTLFFVVLFCFLLFIQYNNARGQKVSITIDGKEVRIGATLQECLDNGLVTTDFSGFETTPSTVLRAREVSYDSVQLGNDQYPQRCPIDVYCYNKTNTTQDISECTIWQIRYSPRFDSADLVPVLVNGIDFWGMKGEDVISTLESQGLKPEMVHDSLIFVKSGDLSWNIELEKGLYFNSTSEDPVKSVIKFDNDTLYVSQVTLDYSRALNITKVTP